MLLFVFSVLTKEPRLDANLLTLVTKLGILRAKETMLTIIKGSNLHKEI
jgi:hypothetical protein